MQATAEAGEVRTEQPGPGVAVVVLAGEHDLAGAEALGEVLAELLGQNELVLADFSEATFVDSSVIKAVLDANNAARRANKTFRIQVDSHAVVATALEICGVFSVVDCVRTRQEGLAPPRT